jgi:predicted nucleic acid-binding protein
MVVIDANLLIAFLTGESRRQSILQYFLDWLENEVRIIAPVLAMYDVVDTLVQLVVENAYSSDKLDDALETIFSLPIQYYPFTDAKRIAEIAMKLEGQSAYEASYLALAERFDCELWTLDEELYRDASAQGFAVRLIS